MNVTGLASKDRLQSHELRNHALFHWINQYIGRMSYNYNHCTWQRNDFTQVQIEFKEKFIKKKFFKFVEPRINNPRNSDC